MGPFKRYILVKGLKFAPHFGLNENLTFYPEPTVVDIVIKFFYCSVQSCSHKSMSHNDK